MRANSRLPASAQQGIHEQLNRLLERHRRAPFRKPYADYNRAAFEASFARRERKAAHVPLILDSCCGVGESTVTLARAFPDHYVIGVDQSAARLGRREREALPPNADLVRADLVDYWRLMRDAGIRVFRHYLLYPNPWPKISHLSRRWHGHPVFPALLELGGILECRSNWPIYIDEFCMAVTTLTGRTVVSEVFDPAVPMTPFERKYRDSGHRLYRAVVDLC